MNTTWFIVANATKAYVYGFPSEKMDFYTKASSTSSRHNSHYLVDSLEHPQGCMKGSQLITDKPGHYLTPGSTRGNLGERNTPHEIELTTFAKKISDFLESGRTGLQFNHLIICAEPRFYGILQKKLSAPLKKLIMKTIRKDYVPLGTQRLEQITANVARHVPVE
jgi:protein required for attachment to host cells